MKDLTREELCLIVDRLREGLLNNYYAPPAYVQRCVALADKLQFEDGHRCRLCDRPAGGSPDHTCEGRAELERRLCEDEV